MIYGYCRCSTDEKKQDIDRQIRDLKNLGVERKNIYLEYETGTKVDRVEFNKLLNILEEGDTVVSTEVSRITRSTKQLIEVIELAKEKKLKLIFGGFVVDCSKELDPMTEGMLKMMGVFAEMERNMISQRVKSGMANAKEKGAIVGRPKAKVEDISDEFKKYYKIYKENDLKKKDLVNMSGLSRPTVDKYIKMLEDVEVEKSKKNVKENKPKEIELEQNRVGVEVGGVSVGFTKNAIRLFNGNSMGKVSSSGIIGKGYKGVVEINKRVEMLKEEEEKRKNFIQL